MKDIDPQKLLAWLAILALCVGWAVTGNNLFNRVAALEGWKTELEKRMAEEKKEVTAQNAKLAETLGQISDSQKWASWNIGAINEMLKEKKR